MGDSKAIISEEIGVEEAAELLGVSPDDVKRHADAKDASSLPVLRDGSKNGYTFSRHDLLALKRHGKHPILRK